MTKLTTERLEKFVNDIKADGMCDITDHQVESALIQLLAYEQADKTTDLKTLVISEIVDFYSGFESPYEPETVDEAQRQLIGRIEKVFGLASPALPKQPDGTLTDEGTIPAQPAMPEQKIVGWIFEDELPKNYPYDAMFAHSKVDVVRMFPVYAPSAAQPVIPEQPHCISDDDLVAVPRSVLACAGYALRNSQLKDGSVYAELRTYRFAPSITAQPVSEPYKLEIDMDDADHFSITRLHEIIYGKELIWPEAKLLARFMLDVKQRASASPAQDDKSASAELPNHSNLSTNSPVIPDGWKLVPIEPTPKMRVSGKHAMKGCESIFEGVIAEVVYGAMVNAAPAQEQK